MNKLCAKGFMNSGEKNPNICVNGLFPANIYINHERLKMKLCSRMEIKKTKYRNVRKAQGQTIGI